MYPFVQQTPTPLPSDAPLPFSGAQHTVPSTQVSPVARPAPRGADVVHAGRDPAVTHRSASIREAMAIGAGMTNALVRRRGVPSPHAEPRYSAHFFGAITRCLAVADHSQAFSPVPSSATTHDPLQHWPSREHSRPEYLQQPMSGLQSSPGSQQVPVQQI
jgi:hypothetical protein